VTTGVVLGKFYPPHLGHIELIRFAASHCDRVVVLVLASAAETIELHDRVEWLEESVAGLANVEIIGARSDAPVDYEGELAWVTHVEQVRALLLRAGVDQVDRVVSSEAYGSELARRLGAEELPFDPSRTQTRVSGTAVRSDLPGTWRALPEAVRRGLAARIIVVGAESTGTSTLAGDLVAHYRAHGYPHIRDVPEYGREHTELLYRRAVAGARVAGLPDPLVEEITWEPADFAFIARRQLELENEATLAAPLVIADTDAWATTVWERRYLADTSGSAPVVALGLPARDLYLVTDHVGVPFDQDGWRDGEHIRPDMTAWFVEGLTAHDESWILLRGMREERLAYAVTAIDALLSVRHRFASPPWATVTRIE
jgi:NadR type nicotinamide-nucleotide adenylyltransferase